MSDRGNIVNLADGMIVELARCQELLSQYEGIGPAGQFGAAMIRNTILRAQEASIRGDVVAMLGLYQELKGCK